MESPCSWPENPSSYRSKAIEELVRGRQFALELRSLLNKLSPPPPPPTPTVENNEDHVRDDDTDGVVVFNQDLVLKILSSFTNTLSILKNSAAGGGCEYDQSSDEVSQIRANAAANVSWDAHARKSEDSSGDSCKSTSIVKDRRGCYKRRKCSDSWIKESRSLVDDGHAWRKYGQKVILNAKYPRNYFRCTHKHDQGCMATKQVQRIEEDPPLFRTTYSGHHTCKSFLKPPHQLLMDSRDPNNNSPVISFCDKGNNNNNHHHPFFSSFPSIKQEYKDDITHNHDQSESSDQYILSPDQDHQLTTTFDSAGVVNSSSWSCSDMGVDVDYVNFDDGDALLQQFEFNA